MVDSLLALLRKGNLRPTAKEIADEAGTSLRSVYVHFDDLEDLFCSASVRQNESIVQLLVPIPDDGPFEERLQQFVQQRCEIWEATAPVRLAASLQEPFSPVLASILEGARTLSTVDVQRVFATELHHTDPSQQAATTAAVDALVSGAAWDHWRTVLKLADDDARAALFEALRALLGGRR